MEISPTTAREWLESPRLNAIARYVASRKALGPDDLPDLLQEIRIALWRAGMDRPVNATWIFHTAEHKAIDIWKQSLSHAVDADPRTPDPAGRGGDPELVHLVRARAASLCGSLREFYDLRYEQGLSERVIAERMQVSRSSVRWMEHRCLTAMGAAAEPDRSCAPEIFRRAWPKTRSAPDGPIVRSQAGAPP
jgi:DNA-directed RNA polymerase specialized sigma24 family protein